jgi:hypothetical protein
MLGKRIFEIVEIVGKTISPKRRRVDTDEEQGLELPPLVDANEAWQDVMEDFDYEQWPQYMGSPYDYWVPARPPNNMCLIM